MPIRMEAGNQAGIAQSAEPTPKIVMPSSNTFRRPMWSESRPMGIAVMATAIPSPEGNAYQKTRVGKLQAVKCEDRKHQKEPQHPQAYGAGQGKEHPLLGAGE